MGGEMQTRPDREVDLHRPRIGACRRQSSVEHHLKGRAKSNRTKLPKLARKDVEDVIERGDEEWPE